MNNEHNGAPLWEVVLPERGRSAIGAKKPTATLRIIHDDGTSESLMLPAAVGRLLSSKQKSGEVCPASRAELIYLVEELARNCCRTRIQRLIDRREYASGEIRQKLQLDGYATHTIDRCLDRAMEVGLVSDARFADSYIRSKISAGWGAVRIASELSRRGINVDDIVGWPYEFFDPEEELERAVSLAVRHRVSGARPYEKLVRYLCSRGFTLDVAKRAAQAALAEGDEAQYGC